MKEKLKEKVNFKTLLEGYIVTKDRVKITESLCNDILRNESGRAYKITPLFTEQIDVPILAMYSTGNKPRRTFKGWALWLCDIGEVTDNYADIYFKGVIDSGGYVPKIKNPTRVRTNSLKYVVISYGGYVSLLKPKEKR